jgi:hypothetical protein
MRSPQGAIGEIKLVSTLDSVAVISREVLAEEPVTETLTSLRFPYVHYRTAHQEHVHPMDVGGLGPPKCFRCCRKQPGYVVTSKIQRFIE